MQNVKQPLPKPTFETFTREELETPQVIALAAPSVID